jgi:hypothetical protein
MGQPGKIASKKIIREAPTGVSVPMVYWFWGFESNRKARLYRKFLGIASDYSIKILKYFISGIKRIDKISNFG